VKLPQPPATTTFTLENGLEVMLAPIPDSPVVSAWVWYRVGSRNEALGTTGAAHWLEHMLFRGSKHYPKGATDRAIIGVGGNLNAFTETDFTAYINVVPSEHSGVPLAIEADRMTGATIPADALDKERNVVLSEREMNENYPEFRVEEEVYALAFRMHPYRWSTLGYTQDIKGMDREKLLGFYKRFYGPRNATLVVSGGFSVPNVRRIITKLFSGLENEVDSPDVRIEEPPQTSSRETTLRGPGSTPIVKVAWHSPAVSNERAAACLLLDLYLGGECPLYTPGYAWMRSRDHPSSRLYQALVDTRIAVRAGSDWHASVQPGLFSVSAKGAPGVKARTVEDALLEEAEKVRQNGIPLRELKELKRKLAVSASTVWTGTAMVTFRYGYFRSLGGIDLERRILAKALRIGTEEIASVARELFGGGRNLVRYLPEGR
jgi:zinc protease